MNKSLAIVLGLLLVAAVPVRAEVSLSPAFGDHMVLQRGVKAPVWGRAAPGEQVTVAIAGRTAEATADADGLWQAAVGPLEAGGPHRLSVSAGQETLTLGNVLVGDVWICSGQSNMEWPLFRARDGADEVAAAEWPRIRLFTVAKNVSRTPIRSLTGQWSECSPATAGSFSAVGYFFGRELLGELDVPIGLIDSSWGGTVAEAWTRYEVLQADDVLRPIVERFEKLLAEWPTRRIEYERQLAEWEAANYFPEPVNEGLVKGWAAPEFDDSEWAEMSVPGAWEGSGQQIDGVVWYRRAVDIPADWAGKGLALGLGTIDDADVAYFNGTQVGETRRDTPNAYRLPRTYTVPGGLVRAGRAVIAVRVYDRYGAGGFTGTPATMRLKLLGGRPRRVGSRRPVAVRSGCPP